MRSKLIMRFLFTYCFLILFLGSAMGQGKYNLPVTVQGKDTLPMYVMGDINLGPQPQPNSNADQIAQLEKEQSWRRLVANVRLLMPYAMDCAKRLKDIDTTMPQLDRRRDRHEYLKEQEAKLNRTRTGRSRAEKQVERTAAERARRDLDGKKLDEPA